MPQNFTKVSCKIEALHDEFVRCAYMKRLKEIENQKLHYTETEIKVCVKQDNYEIKLPHTGQELLYWANELSNCMAGYFGMIDNNLTTIYGFFQEGVLKFAVEVSDNKIVQAQGKYNRDLDFYEKLVLENWFDRFYNGKKTV